MRALFWLIGVLAILGTPIFALMGGASELAWLTHPDPSYRHLRYLAPTVLDSRFVMDEGGLRCLSAQIAALGDCALTPNRVFDLTKDCAASSAQ